MKAFKIGVIFVVAVMALAGIGVGYAANFSETMKIKHTINTADFDVRFTNAASFDTYGQNDPGLSNIVWTTFPLETVPGEYSDEYPWKADYGRYAFDNARTEVQITTDGETEDNGKLEVTVHDGYPSYVLGFSFEVKNIGDLGAKLDDITISYPANPSGHSDDAALDLAGIELIGWKVWGPHGPNAGWTSGIKGKTYNGLYTTPTYNKLVWNLLPELKETLSGLHFDSGEHIYVELVYHLWTPIPEDTPNAITFFVRPTFKQYNIP